RVEDEGVVEEGEVDGLAVSGLDGDLARRRVAPYHDARRRVRQPDVLHCGRETPLNRTVVERRGEPRLRVHLVEQAVVAEEHLADVDAVVEHRDKDQEQEQAARGARAARPRTGHHCDWAPSTISSTSFWSAIFRPSAGC